MIKEILEQPEVLSSLISTHLDDKKNQIDLKLSKGSLEALNQSLKDSSQVLILACGSSCFAGLFAKYVLEELPGISVQVETASEFIYRKSCLLPKRPPSFLFLKVEKQQIF